MPVYVPTAEERPEGVAYEAVPAGSYHLQVVKSDPAYASSGNEMVEWAFEIINHEELEKRRVFFRSVLSEGAMAYPNTGFWDLLGMFGILEDLEGQDFDGLEALCEYLTENLVETGATIYATVERKKYNGKWQNAITAFEADSEEADAPAPKGEPAPEPSPPPPTRTTSPSNKPAAKKTAAKRAGGPPY